MHLRQDFLVRLQVTRTRRMLTADSLRVQLGTVNFCGFSPLVPCLDSKVEKRE